MSKKSIMAACVVALMVSLPSYADDAHHKPGAGAAAAELTAGEVRKIDKDAGKITIKHGEIRHLEMPPMTMVFRVKDPAMLDQVKRGEKVQFMVEDQGGALTITRIAPAQ